MDYAAFMLAWTGWTGILTFRTCTLWRQRTQLVRFIRLLWAYVLYAIYVFGYFAQLERQDTW
jgi:hypothetical protein